MDGGGVVVVRLAGPEGKSLTVPFSGDATVSDVIEKLREHFALSQAGAKMLVFQGKILKHVSAERTPRPPGGEGRDVC
jgi:hypothetical protein